MKGRGHRGQGSERSGKSESREGEGKGAPGQLLEPQSPLLALKWALTGPSHGRGTATAGDRPRVRMPSANGQVGRPGGARPHVWPGARGVSQGHWGPGDKQPQTPGTQVLRRVGRRPTVGQAGRTAQVWQGGCKGS